jgi:hypothetical protein
MHWQQLKSEMAHDCIGRNIFFKSRGRLIYKKILDVSKSGKTVYIDHPDLKNNIQIISRMVMVFI